MSERYVVFMGDRYYADGGWWDFHSFQATIAEAEGAIMGSNARGDSWAHVVDTETNKMVFRADNSVDGESWVFRKTMADGHCTEPPSSPEAFSEVWVDVVHNGDSHE